MYSHVLLTFFKLLIILLMFGIHVQAEDWNSSQLYGVGWVAVLIVMVYVLAVTIVVARNLFEGASSSKSNRYKPVLPGGADRKRSKNKNGVDSKSKCGDEEEEKCSED